MQLYVYGTVEPIYFKLSLNGVGQSGIALADDDVHLYINGIIYGVDLGEIGTECAYVTGTNGIYRWQPILPAQTQGKILILDIKDADAGGLFDENMIQIMTGGNINAFLGNIP